MAHRILTSILAIAVIILFYLVLTRNSQTETISETAPGPGLSLPVISTIVYINSDSLLDNYTYFKQKKAEFESRDSQIKNELKSASERLQKEAADYQQGAAMMTDNDRLKKEEELMQKQEKLMARKEQLLDDFENDQDKFNDELYKKLSSYLKVYNKNKNYSFILGYQKGGGILFANDSLDITSEILDGLNKEYGSK